jgi:hypothetical protein
VVALGDYGLRGGATAKAGFSAPALKPLQVGAAADDSPDSAWC